MTGTFTTLRYAHLKKANEIMKSKSNGKKLALMYQKSVELGKPVGRRRVYVWSSDCGEISQPAKGPLSVSQS